MLLYTCDTETSTNIKKFSDFNFSLTPRSKQKNKISTISSYKLH